MNIYDVPFNYNGVCEECGLKVETPIYYYDLWLCEECLTELINKEIYDYKYLQEE